MKFNVGVIGLGNMGKIHYRIYRQLKEIGKIYLVDTNIKIKNEFQEEFYKDYKDLKGKVDLVSIATPTLLHYKIASFFLKSKIPVLVEKPLTTTTEEAQKLIMFSERYKTLLFAGHVERYNNAYIAIKKMVKNPKFIECHRLSPYPHRSLDISVVLDLMIHDLDIILDLVKDKIKKVEAKGVKVLSPTEDIANARIIFKKGCVANITSSRISRKKERKIRIFMRNRYISLDYAQQKVEVYQKIRKRIIASLLPINKEEPLEKEICEFIRHIKEKRFTLSYAKKAKDALSLSLKIQKALS